ncbi:MAG: hypothetical protein ACE5FN_10515 [Leptospirillia bacterium]
MKRIQNSLRSIATATAVVAGMTATALLGASPAHAYKVDDSLELKVKLYADWTLSADNDADAGFHNTRQYFEARKHLDNGDLIRLTLDTKAIEDSTTLKYAYWQHKLNSNNKIKVGLHHTPLVDYYQNEIWGHRFVNKEFTDEWKAQTSSDAGVSLIGKAAEGMVNYHLTVSNGEGYGHAADGNGYAVSGRVEVAANGVKVGAFGYSETEHGAVNGPDRERYLGYLAWENDTVRVAGEYLTADDSDGSTFKDGTGYSLNANVKLPAGNKAQAFARYDSIDKTDNGTDETLTIAGVSFEAAKGVTLAPTFKSKDNGTTTEDTVAVYGQFKF